jgi:hypothetical protein
MVKLELQTNLAIERGPHIVQIAHAFSDDSDAEDPTT